MIIEPNKLKELTQILSRESKELTTLLESAEPFVLVEPLPFDDTPTDACQILFRTAAEPGAPARHICATILSQADTGKDRIAWYLSKDTKELQSKVLESNWVALIDTKETLPLKSTELLELLQASLYGWNGYALKQMRTDLNKPATPRPFDPFEL